MNGMCKCSQSAACDPHLKTGGIDDGERQLPRDAGVETDGRRRSVAVFIDGSRYTRDYYFVATNESVRRPVVVEADDLRSALKISTRINADQPDHMPMPILLVDASSASPQSHSGRYFDESNTRPRDRGVRSQPNPAAIASLLLDCALIGLADGAIIAVDPQTTCAGELFDQVSDILQSRGISVSPEIEGWLLCGQPCKDLLNNGHDRVVTDLPRR